MIIYSVSQGPTGEPITLEEAKAWLKVDGDEEDDIIEELIISARMVCETYSGLSFMTQIRTVSRDNFCGEFILPYGPVTELSSLKYFDGDDVEVTLDPSDYTLDTKSKLAKVKAIDSWPVTNRGLNNITATYTAGYGDASAVPAVIKLAIKKRIALDYEKRGDSDSSSGEWMELLDTVKVYWNAETGY